jgi:hypothetical protein
MSALPDAYFIVLLRDPVEMAHAFHMEQVFNTFENVLDFQTAWSLQKDRAAGRNLPARCREPKKLQYREICAVGQQLERLYNQVPPERRLTLFLEDMQQDPSLIYKKVLQFLELQDDARTKFPVHGAAHFNRFPWLAGIYQDPPAAIAPVIRTLRTMVQKTGMVSVAKHILMRNSKRASMSPDFLAELRLEFEPEVRLIERLTERSLPHWKKDNNEPEF